MTYYGKFPEQVLALREKIEIKGRITFDGEEEKSLGKRGLWGFYTFAHQRQVLPFLVEI